MTPLFALACALACADAAAPGAVPDAVPPAVDDGDGFAAEDGEREAGVEGRAGTFLELDTNANRVPSGSIGGGGRIEPLPGETVEKPTPDGLLRVEGSTSLWWKRGRLALKSDNDAGLKVFFTQSNEDMLVAQTRETLSSLLGDGGARLNLSLLVKGRGQLSGARTYGLVGGGAVVDVPLRSWLTLRGGVDGHGFHSFDFPAFSSAGAGALLGASLADGPERIDVYVDGGGSGFPFASKNLADPNDPERRTDGVFVASVGAVSARKLYLSLGYTLMRNASNARGESFTRHRVGAVVGFRLPAQVTCTAQGTLQLTQYDDGVSVGQVYFLGDDEESLNVLDFTVSRPLIGPLSAVARFAFTGNELAVEGARFSRETAAIGLVGAW